MFENHNQKIFGNPDLVKSSRIWLRKSWQVKEQQESVTSLKSQTTQLYRKTCFKDHVATSNTWKTRFCQLSVCCLALKVNWYACCDGKAFPGFKLRFRSEEKTLEARFTLLKTANFFNKYLYEEKENRSNFSFRFRCFLIKFAKTF